MLRIFTSVIIITLLSSVSLSSQGIISGNFSANGNFFIRDAEIGASNTPQYDHQLFGAESWLDLKYSNWGFDFGLRFDLFNNSNLLNPNDSYTDQGIGFWYIRKNIQKLDITAGYIYDQIGSGIIYRAYEARPLAIDNALFGVRVGYDLNENWHAKAFTGRQKRQFDLYDPIIKGANLEGYFAGGDSTFWSMAPGIGIVNRTLDDENMNNLVSTLATYSPEDSIGARYNTFAFTLYNTLTFGNFSWYVEGAYKTPEPINDPDAVRTNLDGSTSLGKYVYEPGTVLYTSLSYASGGFGATVEFKRTDYFFLRVLPTVEFNSGTIAFLPPMARQNTYRLTARYNAATQELGELAFQADLGYKINKKWSAGLNIAYIDDLDGNPLYREIYPRITFEPNRKNYINLGLQFQLNDLGVYINKRAEKGNVYSITPFVEYLYKFSRRNSLRIEAQYMKVDANWGGFRENDSEPDFGDWIFAQAEFSMAPKWIFTVSDMYNVEPKGESDKALHYPTVGVTYLHNSNRFNFSYVKQVEGIVCTGGVCRLEPAFSGFRLSINSTF